MTKLIKVLIDTNVLVAASIQANISEINLTVKHPHYDESRKLFSVFQKNVAKQLGITTKTVRGESFKVITRAVNSIINDKKINDPKVKQDSFKIGSKIVNLCDKKMKLLLNSLVIEQANENEVKIKYQKVKEMAEYIKTQYEGKYINKMNRNIEAKRRTERISNTKWNEALKEQVYWAHRKQVEQEKLQPKRFMSKYPNEQDSRILSEAIAIKEKLEKQDVKINFYIASCDMGFFAPLRLRNGGISNMVTNEIRNRFNIVCDLPREIEKKCFIE